MKNTHILVPIHHIEAQLDMLRALQDKSLIPEMYDSPILILQEILGTYKAVNLNKRVIGQKAVDFAGDRKHGGGHGYPSFSADLIEKGYNQAIKDLLL